MSYGLSDHDRELLERGRQEAAEKMAQERQHLRESAELQAEVDARRRAENLRLGPRTVTGPDGVPVELRVAPSGFMGLDGSPADIEGCLLLLPIIIVVGLFGWVNHVINYRRGYTLHVRAAGRKLKLRERSEEAAAQRLAHLVTAIESQGLAALK